jgi:DNA polymerase-3 subunit epsilon/ATP-dependent DNA helicase DinG
LTTFVALDVEGTGMDPARHEIIEVAAVAFDRERVVDRLTTLVKPRGRVSLDIAVLTGIDPAALQAAPTFGEVAPRLRRFIAGRALVGQSIGFDLAMLHAAGLELPNPVYDTYELATLLVPDLPAYNLTTIAHHLGVAGSILDSPASHRAAQDAEVTAGVFQALLARIDQFDATTVEQLAAYARAGGLGSAELFATAARASFAGPLFERPTADADAAQGPHELTFLTSRDRPEPLRPTGSRHAVPPAQIRAAFAQDGPLARVVPGYERRPQQESMALAVSRTLDHDGHLLVEAGTGTGKSLAYLLPAALHALERGEPVVVSTNTLALQDQLYRKDIPDLKLALAGASAGADGETPFQAAILKGRTNYLCLRRWFAWQRQPVLDPAEARLRAKIVAWLGTTETGDRAELRLAPDEDALWRHVAEEEGACIASRCVFQQRNQCFLYRARRRAEQAHLVIVNHALLLSDVMAGSRVLPEYERLVIDEAHHLEDQATSQFGVVVDERAIGEILDGIARRDASIAGGSLATTTAFLNRSANDGAARRRAEAATERLRAALDQTDRVRAGTARLFQAINELLARGGGEGGFDRTLRLTDGVRHDRAWIEIEAIWEGVDHDLRRLDETLRWFLEAVEAVPSVAGSDGDDGDLQRDELINEIGVSLRAVAELAVRLQTIVASPPRDQVSWIERSPAGDRPSLRAAPLHVGDVLRDQLFAPLRSVVLTSATITTDGTFDYIAERLGIEESDEVMVPSPFDYERSTLLCLANDMPEPNAPGYQRRLQETLVNLCAATRGRALVLFTSHAALQTTARAIKAPLEAQGIVVLAQRLDGSPRQLIERLRHTPNVVVLGTATFWEGVDIVGSALSLLVITKLPFSVPSDPVFAARSELFDQPFLDYAVPQAVLRFKQGFGRLIRSSRDRGVCAVLDHRVLSKRYGASFVQSLPECSINVGSTYDLPAAAADWLDGGAEAGA